MNLQNCFLCCIILVPRLNEQFIFVRFFSTKAKHLRKHLSPSSGTNEEKHTDSLGLCNMNMNYINQDTFCYK